MVSRVVAAVLRRLADGGECRYAYQGIGGLASELLAQEVHDELKRGLGLQLELAHLTNAHT
jgi:hypothetical protein